MIAPEISPADLLRLNASQIDETSIHLDCTPQWLAQNIGRFAIGGVHLATPAEVEAGYMPNAIIPDDPVPLTEADLPYLAQFCAVDETPPSMCVGFGTLPDGETIAERAIMEAGQANFVPYYGGLYTLGSYEGRLIQVLHSKPHVRTTIIRDPKINHITEPESAKSIMGMHNDNGWRFKGEESEERLEAFPRGTRMELAGRRLLYNSGPGDRLSLVALALSAPKAADLIRPGDEDYLPNTLDTREYLANNPGLVREIAYLAIRVRPGEMLLLPAGNALHDGSMLGCDEGSSLVIFAGKYPRRAFTDSSMS